MKKTFIISAILVGLLYSCISFGNSILIINYSDQGQIVYCTCSDSISLEMDGVLMKTNLKQFDDSKSAILDADVYVDQCSSNWLQIPCKEEDLRWCCKDSLVRFFFITDTVFLNHPWDTIVKYQMYNRKLVFSEEVWRIEYKVGVVESDSLFNYYINTK